MEKIKMYVEVRTLIEVEAEIDDDFADALIFGRKEPSLLTGECSDEIYEAMEKQGIEGNPIVIDYDFIE